MHARPPAVTLGHFVADLLWLVYAKIKYAQAPRPDLIAHHLLALLGFTFMMDTPGALLASAAVRVRFGAQGAFSRCARVALAPACVCAPTLHWLTHNAHAAP